MSRGGARNRSGPKPSETSGRSEQRGYNLTALPAEGYQGKVPGWPLPEPSERELEVWTSSWRTPQACAWSMPSEQWRTRSVALWVRLSVRCEDKNSPATLFAHLHRLGDQIGMTTAGLAEMGWKVAVDQVAEKREVKPATRPSSSRARLKAVSGGE